ncbi:MAG: hypothetical protein JRF63_06975, partial [Deltaproteobacteria bacterium]|nr:hypothetical protein [Deltaproteobacteria bacterium]
MIRSHVEQSRELTIHVCSGKISEQDLRSVIKRLYDGSPTLHNLWDLSAADISGWTADEIRQLALAAKSYAPDRVAGKTALVTPRDVDFGL